MTSRHLLSFKHWARFGPYEYRLKFTKDQRIVHYLLVNGKQFAVANKVFFALSQAGKIIKDRP